MKKYLKNKIIEIIQEFVGEKPINNFYDSWSISFDKLFSSDEPEDKSKGTGIFKDIYKLEDKVKALEEFLNIEYKIEEKKFSGYRLIKKEKKVSKKK